MLGVDDDAKARVGGGRDGGGIAAGRAPPSGARAVAACPPSTPRRDRAAASRRDRIAPVDASTRCRVLAVLPFGVIGFGAGLDKLPGIRFPPAIDIHKKLISLANIGLAGWAWRGPEWRPGARRAAGLGPLSTSCAAPPARGQMIASGVEKSLPEKNAATPSGASFDVGAMTVLAREAATNHGSTAVRKLARQTIA